LKQETGLPHTEFQSEPLVGASYGLTTADLPDFERLYGPSAASLEALLLGLQFRDWLTDSECALLRQFAPRSGRIVLFADDEILNPQDADGLPEDIHTAATGQHADAIFTHRCQLSGCEMTRAVVHTGRVGAIRGRNLTLAICEPERDPERAHRIEASDSLLSRFRAAFKQATEIAASLQSRLPTDTPYLAVNRASGRVLIASDDLVRLLGNVREAILDAEYSSLSKQLRGLMAARGLHMDNVSTGEMHLAVISVLPERRTKQTTLVDPTLTGLFIRAARDKVAAITAASDRPPNPEPGSDPEGRDESAAIIASEVAELSGLIDGLDLLHGEVQSRRALPVVDEVCEAARLTGERLGQIVEIRRPVNPIQATLIVPQSALRVLTETALRSHNDGSQKAATTIMFASEENGLKVTITTRADDEPRSIRVRRTRLECAARLAEVLGIACSHSHDDDGCLKTTLTIPLEEICS
jgi:hypothetical protein